MARLSRAKRKGLREVKRLEKAKSTFTTMVPDNPAPETGESTPRSIAVEANKGSLPQIWSRLVLSGFAWMGRPLHVSSKWASRFGAVALMGGAVGMVQVDEYAASIAFWIANTSGASQMPLCAVTLWTCCTSCGGGPM